MNLIDLKRTAADIKEEQKNYDVPVAETASYDGPKYPWGLELRLENETLEKLSIQASDFTAGDTVSLVCKAEVTETRSVDRVEGGSSDSLTFQITSMAVVEDEKPKEKNTIRDALNTLK